MTAIGRRDTSASAIVSSRGTRASSTKTSADRPGWRRAKRSIRRPWPPMPVMLARSVRCSIMPATAGQMMQERAWARSLRVRHLRRYASGRRHWDRQPRRTLGPDIRPGVAVWRGRALLRAAGTGQADRPIRQTRRTALHRDSRRAVSHPSISRSADGTEAICGAWLARRRLCSPSISGRRLTGQVSAHPAAGLRQETA